MLVEAAVINIDKGAKRGGSHGNQREETWGQAYQELTLPLPLAVGS